MADSRRRCVLHGKLDSILLADDDRLVERPEILESLSVNGDNPVSALKPSQVSGTAGENGPYGHGTSRWRILIIAEARSWSRVPYIHNPQDTIGRNYGSEEDRHTMAQEPRN